MCSSDLLFNDELDTLTPDSYLKVPHSVSAILHKEDEIKIDGLRTFDEQDRYLAEESLLSPPEHQADRFWRRNVTRLTYLVVQLFYALLTGKLTGDPLVVPWDELPHKLTPKAMGSIENFLKAGTESAPEKRFQNLIEVRNQLKELKKEIFRPSSPSPTARNLPRLSRLAVKETEAKQTLAGHGYEIQAWNARYEKASKSFIEIPAILIVGRKTLVNLSAELETGKEFAPSDGKEFSTSGGKELSKSEEMPLPVFFQKEKIAGLLEYTLLVEGDSCLSRKHVRIVFPIPNLRCPSSKTWGVPMA